MSRVKMISEIFQTASEMKTKKERIDFLRANESNLMQYVVQGAYHPGVKWLLPKGEPPYKPASEIDTYGTFHQEFHKLYLFCDGANTNLTKAKREKLFIDLLSVLHPQDAKLLCAVKDKYIPYPFLTYALFRESFPNWLPEKGE
jgi:hypothetical protein